jgi:hypothetical protein
MTPPMSRRLAAAAVASLLVAAPAVAQTPPQVQLPRPGVPEIVTLEDTFVRVAYNGEGYAIIAYEVANLSVGEEWMLLDFGTTVLEGTSDSWLRRDALSLETPDGRTLLLPTFQEFRSADTRAAQRRVRTTHDSVNYFPRTVDQPCAIRFFAGGVSDKVELNARRGCVGRLFFNVPGGITYGQHWLNVTFEKSLIRVPFRILTKDEQKLLSTHYKSIRQQVDEAFRR